MKSSARNQFAGVVSTLEDLGGACAVTVACDGGLDIVAHISVHSLRSLKLAVGSAVVVLVKASSIVVATELSPLKLSAENCLSGSVVCVEQGAVNNVVTLALPQGLQLSATITLYSSESLALRPGQAATAVFNAAQVILGVLS